MSVTSILRDTNNNVSLVRMITTDDLATVGSANYIANQMPTINSLNSGTWAWYITDMILCSASDGNGFFFFTNSTFSTLMPYGEQGHGTVNPGLAGQLTYYPANGSTVSGLTAVNNAVLVDSAMGIPTWTPLTNGQLIIGSTSGAPIAANLSAGTGIGITNGSNSITISAIDSGLNWSTITAGTLNAAVNNIYVANHASTPLIATLPSTAALGSLIGLVGLAGSGGWTLTANTGQTIQFGNQVSSSGGSWSSGDAGDSIYVACIVANTVWTVIHAVSQDLAKA